MRYILNLLFCLLCIGELLHVPSVIYAQEHVTNVPLEYSEKVDDWVTSDEVKFSPFHRNRFNDTYKEEIQYGQIYHVAKEMVSLFDKEDWNENEKTQSIILNQLYLFLEAIKISMHSPGIEGALDKLFEQNIFIKSFNKSNFGLKSLNIDDAFDNNNNAVHGYFVGTENKILLYEQLNDTLYSLLLTGSQVRQWRLLENALSDLIHKQVDKVSEANIFNLKNAVKRWENYLENGYAMMPWESLLNGWVINLPEASYQGSPNYQWILLHPTIGFEMSTFPLKETKVKEAMHIQLLGGIFYWGDELENFSGISAAISLREDLNPGIGALVHINRNWNVGITWHDFDQDPFFFFSVDLFNFAKTKVSAYEKQYDKLQQYLNFD